MYYPTDAITGGVVTYHGIIQPKNNPAVDSAIQKIRRRRAP